MYNSIRPGREWLDTDGKRIQTHGGSMLYWGNKFWWYGENKEKTTGQGKIQHWGVKMYSSDDLYNWKDEGIVLDPVPDDFSSPLHPERIVERPHIIYNRFTKKFVLWAKLMGNDERINDSNIQRYAIATSNSINGKYTLVRTIHPCGMNSGDFDLVVNESDGKAYIYFERVHTELICADLTHDYTDVTGYYSSHFPFLQPPFTREAPAFFTRYGMKYLFTSGTTGYFPNSTDLAVSRMYHGEWKSLGDPCVNDTLKSTFDSQISSVFRHPHKKDLYIAIADRWLTDLPKDNRPDIPGIFEYMFAPDKSRLPNVALADLGALTAQNTSVADYVLLPVRFSEERIYLEWLDEWRVEDFE